MTQDELKSVLHYDAVTGVFTRLNTDCPVGWNQSGYLKYEVLGKKYYLHRLVWLYIHGVFPDEELDHINNNRADNRLCNLRPVTPLQNRYNTPVRRDNQSGFKGVEFVKHLNKYRACIKIEGVRKRSKLYLTAEEASRHYLKEARIHQKEYCHG